MQIQITVKEGMQFRLTPLTPYVPLTTGLTWTVSGNPVITISADSASPEATVTIGKLSPGQAQGGGLVTVTGSVPATNQTGQIALNDSFLVTIQRAGPVAT